MEQEGYELGMIGLGTMGRNLLLNMADNGFSVVGYDRNLDKVEALRNAADGRAIRGVENVAELVDALRKPRAVMLLVPAGAPVDAVIQELLPRLDKGDMIIDAGNSHFSDTDRRHEELSAQGIAFLGVGVSGGEFGARHGPSMMPGGPREAYERVRPVLEAVAAKVRGVPCVAYMGPRSAGHYVKMVHNGIEYGLMEIIAESYDVLARGLGFGNDELHEIYERWNQEELESYLMKITARIFAQRDPVANGCLIDHIRDTAAQHGTGMWTSQHAMTLGVPVPTIDIAVTQRNLSSARSQRSQLARHLAPHLAPHLAAEQSSGKKSNHDGDRNAYVQPMRNAVYAAMILTYTQGMALLSTASEELGYQLRLEDIATIWRGGCIIRARLLEDIRNAYRQADGQHADLPNLLLDQDFADKISRLRTDLASIVTLAAKLAIPAPALMASLSYLDSYASERMPTNLIQAQRDFFGSHTYERIDREGAFHTDWTRGEEDIR